eukprot:5733126-Pyramimonas_sp.AAC.1
MAGACEAPCCQRRIRRALLVSQSAAPDPSKGARGGGGGMMRQPAPKVKLFYKTYDGPKITSKHEVAVDVDS